MTDREKLIALLEKHEYQNHYPSTLASILLANGVVVREKGEWKNIGGDEWCCTVCGYVGSTEGRWEPMTDDFCRGCGSDMRKG